MVIGEGNKGVFMSKGSFVIYCQDQKVKRDMFGKIVKLITPDMKVTNSSWTQIVSGKLTQWSDY